MKIHEQALILDGILAGRRADLGADFTAYRNHCYRVMNFTLAFSGENPEIMRKVSIAAAFHDLGIWTNNTYDYLDPSRLLARAYLAESAQDRWREEIETMIEQHHKLGAYTGNPGWLVEPFRQADWIDVSKGMLKFGLTATLVKGVMERFPNAGFHKRLVALSVRRLITHPLSPLPMLKR